MRVRGDAAARQQKEIEKRYGSVRDVFRKRGEESGRVLGVTAGNIIEVTDRERIERHFRIYKRTVLDLVVRNVRTLSNVYKVKTHENMHEAHVVWMFGDIGKTISREREFFERIGSIKDDDETVFDKIPNRIFEKLYRNPELVGLVNETLLLAFSDAVDFRDWKTIPKGIIITGTGFLAAVEIGHISEFRNDALGIEVGSAIVEEILNGKEEGLAELSGRILPIILHEMVHMQPQCNEEAQAHAIETLAVWMENPGDRDALEERLVGFAKKVSRGHISWDNYDSEAYLGMALAMNELARYNENIARVFEEDAGGFGIEAIARSLEFVREEDMLKAKENGFVERVLRMKKEEIIDEVIGALALKNREALSSELMRRAMRQN